MSDSPTFEQYLNSKKIDSDRFRSVEPETWETWEREFAQMHPNSFTVQKLNLINGIRRKYLIPTITADKTPPPTATKPITKAVVPPVRPGKPVMRPKVPGSGGGKGESGE